MDINSYIDALRGCSCGRIHTADLRHVVIESKIDAGKVLKDNHFPKKILLVADKNTLSAAGDIESDLARAGFLVQSLLYDDLRVATDIEATRVARESAPFGGILSVGSGSLNDICRRGALLADKDFAIFATAPSMDGFASGTAPITHGQFKTTLPARQPSVIMGDTKILAAAPSILKGAGFGDMMAKYIALSDWKVSHLLTGEYYCPEIAALVRRTIDNLLGMADKVNSPSEEAAGAVMESLVLTGIAMKLADSVRPASGTEHIIAHFWEIQKLAQGKLSDFHGRKVGVGTLYAARLYHALATHKTISAHPDKTDWDAVYAVYGKAVEDEIRALNTPSVTDETTPSRIEAVWSEICAAIAEIPAPAVLEAALKKADCATTAAEIDVSEALSIKGAAYHPYMRHRMTLWRLLPMLDVPINFSDFCI